VTSGTPEV